MQEKFEKLLKIAIQNEATDIHFVLKHEKLFITIRGNKGIVDVKEKFDKNVFYYLKFISNLDLGNLTMPQSGNFTYFYKKKEYHFRLSCIQTSQLQSGVLRILNNHQPIEIMMLSKEKNQNLIFKKWANFRSGLVLVSGPTGSGKTTTLHAILETIAKNKKLKVIALEDPIEIPSENYLQFQINEKMNFTYEEGIKQLLRHDPDVIMIGEIRDTQTAKMLVRCALSGHMVFSTIHAKTCKEGIIRLLDFGVNENDLKEVLTGLTNQRIFLNKNNKGRCCIYEIMEKEDIQYFFTNKDTREEYQDIFHKIQEACDKNWIKKKDALVDMEVK